MLLDCYKTLSGLKFTDVMNYLKPINRSVKAESDESCSPNHLDVGTRLGTADACQEDFVFKGELLTYFLRYIVEPKKKQPISVKPPFLRPDLTERQITVKISDNGIQANLNRSKVKHSWHHRFQVPPDWWRLGAGVFCNMSLMQ